MKFITSFLFPFLVLSYLSDEAMAIGCSCVCQSDGSGGFTPKAYIDTGECGTPTGCEGSDTVTAQVACYKCGTGILDCVIDTDDQSVYDAIKPIVEGGKDSGFCKIGQGTNPDGTEKLATQCGQQSCDQAQVAPFGYKPLFPVFDDSLKCPLHDRGVSNFGTYTVTAGTSCPSCTASKVCLPMRPDKITCTPDAGGCAFTGGSTTCNDGKCEEVDCPCSFCETGLSWI